MNRRALLLALPLLMFAAPAFADDARTISTTGTASVYVAPDEAEIRFSVHTFDKDLAQAKQLNDNAADETLTFLQSAGVENKDVQTAFVASEAVYEDVVKDGRPMRGPISGYNVRRDYSVKLRDITKLSAVYDQLLPDARVTLQGHTLSSSKARKYRDQARTEAAKAAKEKADLLAKALDSTVGAPRQVTENNFDRPFFYGYAQNNFRADAGGGPGGDVSPVGQIEMKAEVNVTFDLLPGGMAQPREIPRR